MRPVDADEAKRIAREYLTDPYHVISAVAVLDKTPTLTPPNEPLPVLVNDEQGREYIDYICPRCKGIISQRRRGQRMETVYQCKFHDNCGQRVDWENQKSYRRPPEGEK